VTDDQKKTLLQLARSVIEQTLKGQPITAPAANDPLFQEKRGCFVTLHNRGRLRGCIGQFQPDQSLWETVRDMAVAAASQDHRFFHNPVTIKELSSIDIEISVLSPLQKTDEPLSLELGKHGIYIKKGYAAGCFLPQVATETGWSKEEFLTQCCAGKAGLPPNAWKMPGTEVYLFTADVFGEKDLLT